MSEANPTSQAKASSLQSGPEIIAGFLKAIEADPNLDRETVQAILSLYASGKLTTNNLQRTLELVRTGKKP
jgi:hypothetical protein